MAHARCPTWWRSWWINAPSAEYATLQAIHASPDLGSRVRSVTIQSCRVRFTPRDRHALGQASWSREVPIPVIRACGREYPMRLGVVAD